MIHGQSNLFGAETTPQLIDRLRLDSPPYHFQSGSPHAILETTADPTIANKAKVPLSGGFEGGSWDDPTPPNWAFPHTRNGLTASRDGRIVPEFRTESGNPVAMPAGLDASGQPITTMRFRFDDGMPYPQTIGGQTASDWMLMPDAASPTGFAWTPIP